MRDAAVGFAGGILAGVGGFAGALPTMWADLKGLRKDDARAVFQPFILVTNLMAAVMLMAGGFVDAWTGWALLASLPALAIGTALGIKAYRYMPAETFRMVLLGLLLLSGLSLVI